MNDILQKLKNMKTKHILLPTDFSANARNAIDYALYLFEKEPCKFFILNSYEVGPSGLSSTRGRARDTRLFRAIREESERSVQRIVKDLESKNQNPQHAFEGLSVADSLLSAIGKSAIDNHIQYIFMGTKGSSGVKEVFMGSSTIKVLKHIDFCPIIAVPESYDFDLPDTIAFATNFEHIFSEVELLPLIDMAKLWDSKVTVIHIDKGDGLSSQQETSRDLLTKRLSGLKFEFIEVEGESKISSAIMAYGAKDDAIGMIAMMNYWHSFFEKLTRENVIKRVAFHTEVPLMIFPLIDA